MIRWDPDHTMRLHLAGTLDATCVADVERALESARQMRTPVVLDLGRVRLIDRPTLQYVLDLMEQDGRSIENCPDHVASWMRRESLKVCHE
jgi:anti-anti-sigma regulatory factor